MVTNLAVTFAACCSPAAPVRQCRPCCDLRSGSQPTSASVQRLHCMRGCTASAAALQARDPRPTLTRITTLALMPTLVVCALQVPSTMFYWFAVEAVRRALEPYTIQTSETTSAAGA